MKKVLIYTTEGCLWCKKVKEFLKNNNVLYQEVDVEKDAGAAQELVKKSGQMGVPVTEINGKILVGFDEKKLKKALNIYSGEK